MKIKDVDPDKVDSTMDAISAVIKALISVAKCFDSINKKPEETSGHFDKTTYNNS